MTYKTKNSLTVTTRIASRLGLSFFDGACYCHLTLPGYHTEKVTPSKWRIRSLPERTFLGRVQFGYTIDHFRFFPSCKKLFCLHNLRFYLIFKGTPLTFGTGIRTNQDMLHPKSGQGKINPETQTCQTTLYADSCSCICGATDSLWVSLA